MSKLSFCALALAAVFSGSAMAQAASQPQPAQKSRADVQAELAKARTGDAAKPGAGEPLRPEVNQVTPAKAKKIKGKAAKPKAAAASAASAAH